MFTSAKKFPKIPQELFSERDMKITPPPISKISPSFSKKMFSSLYSSKNNVNSELHHTNTTTAPSKILKKILFFPKSRCFTPYLLKALCPFVIAFSFTLLWNHLMKSTKFRCLGVDLDTSDNCPSFSGPFGTTLLIIHVCSSGHFVFGCNLLYKYSVPQRKKILIALYFVIFMTTHFVIFNVPLTKQKTAILFKVGFIVLINANFIVILSLFIGHPSPLKMMRNYLFFEVLISSIPPITAVVNYYVYYVTISYFSNGTALIFLFFVNEITDFLFSGLMRKTILATNKFLENIDFMPGVFILTGYLDGVFYGNLFPQDINSFGFFINLLLNFLPIYLRISGINEKLYLKYCKWRKRKINKDKTIELIENGSQFYSIVPVFMMICFIYLETPYIYGSTLFNYNSYTWLDTTNQYPNLKFEEIFSFQKFLIVFGFWLILVILGVLNRKNYVFCEINLSIFIQNIFFTFKTLTMFTVGFEFSVQIAQVVYKDLFQEIIRPIFDLLGINIGD